VVAAHPLRERLHGQLMVALYRGGRQAEALDAYRAARQMLIRELGLEPGPALRRLERAILRQDPALDPPDPPPAPPAPVMPRTRQTRLAAIAAIGAVVLAASLLIGFRGPPHAQATLAGASGLVAVDTASDQLADKCEVTSA
jgi:Bacterial transcriptional activator domain